MNITGTGGDRGPNLVTLPHKRGARIAYHHFEAADSVSSPTGSPNLLVFVNGMMLPMNSWSKSIELLHKSDVSHLQPFSVLTYDRYGQGQSYDHDPTDDPSDPSRGHGILSSVNDLHHLLAFVLDSHFHPGFAPKIIFVAHSIGVPLSRLYCQTYTGAISAMLFLASNIANSDMLSVFPDPSSPSFEPRILPPGVTASDLTALRLRISQTFPPAVGSSEGLSRRNLPSLLPHANAPRLNGPDNAPPSITVVKHGLDAFAEERLRMTGTPKALNELYMNPYWWKYNEGLCELTDRERCRGVIVAVGAGHFVQKDRPDLVAWEIEGLLRRLDDVKSRYSKEI